MGSYLGVGMGPAEWGNVCVAPRAVTYGRIHQCNSWINDNVPKLLRGTLQRSRGCYGIHVLSDNDSGFPSAGVQCILYCVLLLRTSMDLVADRVPDRHGRPIATLPLRSRGPVSRQRLVLHSNRTTVVLGALTECRWK